jgi:hypothetical protein
MPFFNTTAGTASTVAMDVVEPVSPNPVVAKETGGSPIFPPNPNTALPASTTTGGRAHQTARHNGFLWVRPCCPRYHKHEDSTDQNFEALSAGFTARCLRFVPASRLTTQDSLAVAGQAFRAGVITRRV